MGSVKVRPGLASGTATRHPCRLGSVAVLLMLAALGGCGQKGPLYFPEPSAKAESADGKARAGSAQSDAESTRKKTSTL